MRIGPEHAAGRKQNDLNERMPAFRCAPAHGPGSNQALGPARNRGQTPGRNTRYPQEQGGPGRRGAGGAGRRKVAPRAGARGAAKRSGALLRLAILSLRDCQDSNQSLQHTYQTEALLDQESCTNKHET